jgi:hypothetical protein
VQGAAELEPVAERVTELMAGGHGMPEDHFKPDVAAEYDESLGRWLTRRGDMSSETTRSSLRER